MTERVRLLILRRLMTRYKFRALSQPLKSLTLFEDECLTLKHVSLRIFAHTKR